MFHRDFKPGDALPAKWLNEKARQLAAARKVHGSGNVVVSVSDNGIIVSMRPGSGSNGFLAKITASSGSANQYSFTEQIPNEGGTLDDGPRTGTYSDSTGYAMAEDGCVDVLYGDLVWLTPAGDNYSFFYNGGTRSADITSLSNGSGQATVGTQTINVKDLTGSPSITGEALINYVQGTNGTTGHWYVIRITCG